MCQEVRRERARGGQVRQPVNLTGVVHKKRRLWLRNDKFKNACHPDRIAVPVQRILRQQQIAFEPPPREDERAVADDPIRAGPVRVLNHATGVGIDTYLALDADLVHRHERRESAQTQEVMCGPFEFDDQCARVGRVQTDRLGEVRLRLCDRLLGLFA